METNKKLQNLIGKIIGKDYFKLEFGCEVNRHCNHREYIAGTFNDTIALVRIDEHGACLPFEVPRETMFTNVGVVTPWEILGQEPTLNDVLLAIEKSNIRKKGCIDLSIDDNYLEVFCDENYEFETLLVRIDLSKSIFNQEESVKVAIINLLEDK